MSNEFPHKGQCDELERIMKAKGIAKYRLSKDTGIPIATLYSVMTGRTKITVEKCQIIADSINVELQNVFPHLKVIAPELADININPKYEPRAQKDEVKMDAKDVKVDEVRTENANRIMPTQMVTSASMLVPRDGIFVRSRQVKIAGDVFDSYMLQNNEQCVIFTGIKAQGVNVDRTLIKTERKLILESEFRLDPFLRVINSELVVVAYNTGDIVQIYRGMEIGELVFI